MATARPSDDLVARVVAWHNRVPLARRITRAHVLSVGLVSFPFFVPAGEVPPSAAAQPSADEAASEQPAGSLRERARARATGPAGVPGVIPSGAMPPAPSRVASTRRKRWQAAFTDDLFDPHNPQRLARWALRHGSLQRPGPADAPVREFEFTGSGPRGTAVVRLWLFTAAIELGAQRVRVLLAPSDMRRVLGHRLFGRGRVAGFAGAMGGAAVAGVAALSVGLGGGRLHGAGTHPSAAAAAPVAVSALASASGQGPPHVPAAAPTAVPTTVAGIASTRSPAQEPTPVLAPSHGPAPARVDAAAAGADEVARAAQPAETAGSAEAPEPRLVSRVKPMRHVVPFLSESARRAAREEGEAIRAEIGERAARSATGRPDAPGHAAAALPAASSPRPSGSASAPADVARPASPTPAPAHARAPASGTPSAAPAPALGTAWAVSTRNLRTRFESEQMLAALRDAAYRGGHGSELKLEVLPAGEDWRAVGWPFATRAEAERLRAALAARGLKAEVVPF